MRFFVFMWAVLLTFSFTASDTNSSSETYNLINSINLTKQGCESRCGNLIVPYPFGVGNDSNCFINDGFQIFCDKSSDPPKATFTETDYSSITRLSDSTVRRSNMVARRCYFPNGTIDPSRVENSISADYKDSPYTFSQVNKFTVIGCGDYAWLTSSTKSRDTVSTGCMAFCSKPEDVVGDECSGNGCCQSSIPQDINYYTTRLNTLLDSSEVSDKRSFNPCTYAFVGEANAFKFNGASDLNDESFVERIEANVPVVLEWAIGNLSCAEAEAADDFACQSNSKCVNSTRETGGYRCECKQGFEGNPYLTSGCQDINECDNREKFPCYGTCVNSIGDYACKCKRWSSGDAKVKGGCRRTFQLSLGIGVGCLILLIGLSSIVHLMVQNRKLKQREKFFKQHGGDLLEDKLKTTGSSAGVCFMTIFRVKELEEATNKFSQDRVLGEGGNGTVYKGTLLDNHVVAIKKARKFDQGQREEFTTEIVILAQFKHPNVVQLLGCCLENDVPLLVYEFVSNNTLHYHIHQTSDKGRLSWVNRLRIAHESAGALAYLHTADARISIVHRDVKSANILLDKQYTAKIADFGASRFVPLGHDEVTTLVKGTLGYLDPEYFHTGQLTDKSDVYSFGVVLAELLTSKQPVVKKKGAEDSSLVTYFVKAKKENQLRDILDPQVVREATDMQLTAISDMVCRCLSLVGGNRPSMEEVTSELGKLRKHGKQHPWNISQESYMTETSSLMVECEEHVIDTLPLVANSSCLGECSSSSTGMKEMMLQIQNPR